MTIAEAGKAIRSRSLSCLELTNRCLAQIDKLNPRLNAFITVTADSARARAQELDRELANGKDRGPLHGIPIAHKDLIHTKGVLTTSGSKLFADFVPDADAPVVTKLADAGALMLGKTGLHELAYGITSENPHYGPVRNPHDPDRSPGGSSGGAGTAVATDMVFIGTGTDTGGSIRIPAAFCGVVGLKPTYGLVDRSRIQPLGFTLDHIGPLTRTVADARLALDVMAGTAKRKPAPAGIKGIRIGLPENFYFDHVARDIVDAVHAAAKKAEQAGAHIISVKVPDIDALNAVGRLILLVEASALHEPHMHRRADFGGDVLALLDQGRLVPATDYVNAQRLRKKLRDDFHQLFTGIDCLFTPASATPAPRIGQKQVELNGDMHDTRLATTRLVRGINVLGFPALTMPCGKSEGLPIGLQIVARPWEENTLLTLGEALE